MPFSPVNLAQVHFTDRTLLFRIPAVRFMFQSFILCPIGSGMRWVEMDAGLSTNGPTSSKFNSGDRQLKTQCQGDCAGGGGLLWESSGLKSREGNKKSFLEMILPE